MHNRYAEVCDELLRKGYRAQLAIAGSRAAVLVRTFAADATSRAVCNPLALTSPTSLAKWLGYEPSHYSSEAMALAMAVIAYQRAQGATTVDRCQLVGLGSCFLDRFSEDDSHSSCSHVAVQTQSRTQLYRMVAKRTRMEIRDQQHEFAHVVLHALARGCDPTDSASLALQHSFSLEYEVAAAASALTDVWSGRTGQVWSMPNGSFKPSVVRPMGIVCGAFDPLHPGHIGLQTSAARHLNGPVFFEMSLINVEKPPLDFLTIERRRRQFRTDPLALTNAPTFLEKSAIFPGVTFVVGVDTAERVLQPRFYDGSAEQMLGTLNYIRKCGCRFLVAGRLCGQTFRTRAQLGIPSDFEDLFIELPEAAFRLDVSSTELRGSCELRSR